MSEVRRSLAAYLVAVAAWAVILVFTFELWRADSRVPLAYGRDALCTQLYAKGIVENGWVLKNPALGAPFGLEMHDFPLGDGLFLLAEKALARMTGDYALVINLYYFSTYFLATIVSLFVLRRFDVPRGPAIVISLLYAFLPYHFFRGQQHLFLASYYLVPLAVMVCLWLIRDGEVLFREPEDGRRARLRLGSRRAVAATVVCLLVGSGGVYYAFFTCYLLLVAGLCAAAMRRKVHPLGSAVLLVGVIAAASVANVAPNLIYAIEHGPNPDAIRHGPEEVEILGLKLVQMLLPVSGHRIEAFRRLRAGYDLTQITTLNENGGATLGAVASLGFLGLLGAFLLRRRSESSRLVFGLAALNLAAVLLATSGGFGTIFGFVVSPIIRNYCRMCIFIAFFSLLAVALVLAWAARTARPGGQRLAMNFGLVALLVVGILDQAPPLFVPEYEQVRKDFANDAEFIGRIEAALPPGAMVFQLPLIDFPEGNEPGTMGPYDLVRAYLHSRSLRWSFGAMKGRYGDSWQKYAADRPAPEMLRTIALAGFSGVYVDRAGYDDRGAAVEAKLAGAIGASAIRSRDARFVFFDLTPFVAALRREYGPDRWAAGRESVLRPMIVTWRGGFHGREEGPDGLTWHWSDGSGEVRIANPSSGPRKVEVSMGLAAMDPAPAKVAIEGPDGEREYPVGSGPRVSMVVPPGGVTLRFRSDARKVVNRGDPRTLAFRVEGFRVEEADGSAPVAAGAARR